MRMRRILLLVFLLVAAAVVGSLLATICSNIPALSWLGYSRTVGISPESPFVLDLVLFRFSFGFTTSLSVAQVVTVGLVIVLYNVIVNRKGK